VRRREERKRGERRRGKALRKEGEGRSKGNDPRADDVSPISHHKPPCARGLEAGRGGGGKKREKDLSPEGKKERKEGRRERMLYIRIPRVSSPT